MKKRSSLNIPSAEVPGVLIFSCKNTLRRGEIRSDFVRISREIKTTLPLETNLAQLLGEETSFVRKVFAVAALRMLRAPAEGAQVFVAQTMSGYRFLDNREEAENFLRNLR